MVLHYVYIASFYNCTKHRLMVNLVALSLTSGQHWVNIGLASTTADRETNSLSGRPHVELSDWPLASSPRTPAWTQQLPLPAPERKCNHETRSLGSYTGVGNVRGSKLRIHKKFRDQEPVTQFTILTGISMLYNDITRQSLLLYII